MELKFTSQPAFSFYKEICRKILREKSNFIFVARLRWEGWAAKRVSHVCGDFKISMSKMELPCGLSGAAPRFFPRFEKKCL